MAKPNYSYEKRQRELAKKQKKEEKSKRKNDGSTEQDADAQVSEAGQPIEAGAAEA